MEFAASILSQIPLAETAGLWESLLSLIVALWNVLVSLVTVVAPWMPLLAWIVFWLFAVNWVKLREVIIQGGWLGVVLIGLVTALIWGTVDPSPHAMLNLELRNYVGKIVYVSVLFCIMFLCGLVQLAGFAPACCGFSQEEDESAANGHAVH